MGLQTLSVHNFRNIAACDIELSPGLNCIEGPNASGKTSLLESIFVLGRARSFRTRHADQLIRSGSEGFRVQGSLIRDGGALVPVGIERSQEGQQIRLAGHPLKRVSELVECFPLQIVNPESHELVEGPPRLRRRFLDWGVFHVEPTFFGYWQRYVKALRQRNAALRQGLTDKQIQAWDDNLIEAAQSLHQLRSAFVDDFENYLKGQIDVLLELPGFQLIYRPGWSTDEAYADTLQRTYPRDCEQGYTRYGPHRADLNLRINNIAAQDRLSRGQQKLLAIAMLLAQARFFSDRTGRSTTFLIDDLAAELDKERRSCLLEDLKNLGAQIVVTALDTDALDTAGWRKITTFHVEHGAFREVVY